MLDAIAPTVERAHGGNRSEVRALSTMIIELHDALKEAGGSDAGAFSDQGETPSS
jgi:hypothetical protein